MEILRKIMIEIKSQNIIKCEVTVPGSKSYTHRILIGAALSDGNCIIQNGLKSEDTLLTLNALKQMSVSIEEHENKWTVSGTSGRLTDPKEPVYLANSGTSMRLLAAVAALGNKKITLTGTERMYQRPIQDLLDGLNQMGIDARSVNKNGCPPVEISGGDIITGGSVNLRCKISSQFLSGILMIAPYTEKGVEIRVTEGPVSKPYIDMTIDVMNQLGVEVTRDGYERFHIQGKQIYKAGDYTVEPDCSNAGYFWAAAAITGGTVKVKGITKDSRQGDIRLTELFEKMGCKIFQDGDGLAVSGRAASAIEADMSDMPDMVPTLAVVAAFAKGTTVIKNVAHLKAKESDRLTAPVNELLKMGIEASCTDTGLIIKGGKPRGAEIDTYNDHRIAMSFAVAGLVTPGLFIRNESCVEKSFPEFWKVFETLK